MSLRDKKIKKKISVLLIIALILGMTGNHFAISDFEYEELTEKNNYYEEMMEENQEPMAYEDIENEDEPEEENIEENIESELVEENCEEEIDEEEFGEAEFDEEATESELIEEDGEEGTDLEEEIDEENADEEATESEVEQEEIEEESDTEAADESEIENDDAVSTESDIASEDEIATESETEIVDEEATESEIATESEAFETASLSMPLLMMAPSFGAPTPHYHDATLYTPIYNESDFLSITSSYVYLANKIEINNAIDLSHFDDKKLFICLNGYEFKFACDKNIFSVGDGEMLTITDCNSTVGKLTTETAGGVGERKTFIKTQGTGKVNVEKVYFNLIEFNGVMFEANDGGCISVSDIKMEECKCVDAVFYAHGDGSKISFSGNNHILNNVSFENALLMADDKALVEIADGETIFEDNNGKTGGITKLTDYAKFTIEGNLIASSNEAEKGGFAYVDNTASFYSSSGQINIENCHAIYGGGLYIDVINTEPFINNSLVYNIRNNFASDSGGGVYLYFNVDANFKPNAQGTFNFYKNKSLHGAGLFISGTAGQNANIKNLCFYEHQLAINESLIEVNVNAIIDNLKIESTNKYVDESGNLSSNGSLIKVVANDNIVKIQNTFLSNDTDKINRAYKGIELAKTNDKTIDLTISTYSLVDKIVLGVDISNIQDDGVSKVNLSHVFTNYTTDNSSFKAPRLEEFPKPDNFYTALSELTGDGTRALSLDYVPNFDTRWDVNYKFGTSGKSIGAMPYWHGTGYSGGYNVTGSFGFVAKDSGHIQCSLGAVANSYYYQCKVSGFHSMYIDAYNKKASNGADTMSPSKPRGMNFNNPGSFKNGVSKLFIFGASTNGNGTRNAHAGTVRSTKISEKGVVIRDFIPVKLTTDIPKSMDRYGISRTAGSTGLWDSIEEQFYEYNSGVATSETTENGIKIYNSNIPVTIDHLNISGNPKRSVYIEESKNISLVDTNIENTNAPANMVSAYVRIIENSEASFNGTTNVQNNTTQKNSIISIEDKAKVFIYDIANFSNNTCILNTDKKSSVLSVERGAELFIKTEDINFENNLTKKGVIGVYDNSKLYIHGHFYIMDNHIYGDASKTLNIYLRSAESAIYYDEEESDPIKATSKIGITSGTLDSDVFRYWNKDSIENYNDGSDITKDFYLPDNIFIPDTSHQNSNQYIYKKGKGNTVSLCIGTNFAILDYQHYASSIGFQRIAKNVETTVDSIYLIGVSIDTQLWEGPSLEDENVYEFWGVTDGTRNVKISANNTVNYISHLHDGSYIFVKKEDDFAYKLNKYKNLCLIEDIELTNKINLNENTAYNICLNGNILRFANGVNIFDIAGNKKLTILNCKEEGYVAISTESALGTKNSIVINNGDFDMKNVKISNHDNSKTSLLSASGGASKVNLSDIVISTNSLSKGYLFDIKDIDKAAFNNIIVKNNTFVGQSGLINISDTDVSITDVDIYDNTIDEDLINIKNVKLNIASSEEYKVHDNTSNGQIVTLSGNVNFAGEKINNTVGNGVYYIKKGTSNIDASKLVISTNDRAIVIDNADVTLNNINIKNCGTNGCDGGAIYLSNGSLILGKNIVLDGNINAIFNNGGKLYLRNPKNLNATQNIEIKNGTGMYVLAASTFADAEFYLLGGKIHDNDTTNVYIRKQSAAIGTNIVTTYVGGDFAINVLNGKRGIHITDYQHEIFKEYEPLKMTNDNRLSYYVEENAVKIFSNFTNESVDKDLVFNVEDANRDPERPMYLDQYEDTKDLYIYYKSIKLQYKYKIEGSAFAYDLNLQNNPQLPRRVTYNSSSKVIIGHPSLSGFTFTGWDGPDIATPNTLNNIVLTNLTDMTPRCYTAYFKYIPHSNGGGGGGSGSSGGGGRKSRAFFDDDVSTIPKQENAKLIDAKTNDVILLASMCEWVYDPIIKSWSLNININDTKVKAANGFYDIITLDSKYNVVKNVYNFDAIGIMTIGWAKDTIGTMYFFSAKTDDNIGKMAIGWTEIADNVWYYFDDEGKLFVNTETPDGKKVGPDGSWIGPTT